MNTNEKYERLHKLFNGMERHQFTTQEIARLQFTGVYVVFEKGEIAHDCDRIVRIGTTTGNNTVLADRLYEHYEDEGRSVFRNHIATCLLKKNGDPLKLAGLFYQSKDERLHIHSKIEREKWKKNEATPAELQQYLSINKEVSRYIEENCSFMVFPADRTACEAWEKKLISTISTCTVCKQSENWLGNNIPNERKKIRESGLWNIIHVGDKNCMTNAELTELEAMYDK